MSLCDTCPKPGACCQRIQLFTQKVEPLTFWDDEPLVAQFERVSSEPLEWLLRSVDQETFTDKESDRRFSKHTFACTKLGADGRCTIYEARPRMCRDFEPASSPLCVLYKAPEEEAA